MVTMYYTCVSTDTSLGFISHLVGCLGSRWWYSLYWPIRAGSAQKGGIFFRLQVYERVGNLSFESVKGPKRADGWILWLYKVEKTFNFCN